MNGKSIGSCIKVYPEYISHTLTNKAYAPREMAGMTMSMIALGDKTDENLLFINERELIVTRALPADELLSPLSNPLFLLFIFLQQPWFPRVATPTKN